MAQLSQEARIERAKLIFGQAPRELQIGKKIKNKDILLAVEDNLVKVSGRDSIKKAVLLVTENLINRSVVESKKHIVKQKVDRLYKRFLKECKRYSVDSRTQKFRVAPNGDDSKKFQAEINKEFEMYPIPVPSVTSVPSVSPVSSVSSSTSTSKFSNKEPAIVASTSNSLTIKSKIRESVASLSSSASIESSSSSEDGDETEAGRKNDPDFHVPKKRVSIIESTDPDIFLDGDRYGKSVESIRHEIYRNNGFLWSNEGLRKARERLRIKAARQKFDPPLVIGFDERRDLCKDQHSNNDTSKRYENCTVIFYYQTEEVYAGHFIPLDGTGAALADGLFTFCEELNVDLSQLVGICTDGCAKMIGKHNGAHVCFERLVGRPLLRQLCIFHKLEKSYSCYASILGFKSTGPSTLAEPWQSLLHGDLHNLPVTNFTVINNNFVLAILQSMDPKVKLSKDHQIFKGLLLCILTGETNKSVRQKIGPINMARFTTSETRVLRRYISSENPPEKLLSLVRYIVNVWAPLFLQSKIFYNKLYMGPEILLLEITLSRKFLTNEEMLEMMKSYNRNGFYANHENILLCMVCSNDQQKRLEAINILLEIRRRPQLEGIREFGPESYEINPYASCLSDLNISPLCNAAHQPPPLKTLSDSEIQMLLGKPLEIQLPITSVAVERGVKDTTRAALHCGTVEARNGFVHNTIRARQIKY